jgi:polysaccharide biosynthesis/export protein
MNAKTPDRPRLGPAYPAKLATLAALAALAFLAVGCASTPPAEAPGPDEQPAGVRLAQFIISPGDELKVSVYKHDDLARDLAIPPDGVIYYPGVGEIDTTGRGVKDVRLAIAQGLSAYREQGLVPGDTISIKVFMHDEYARQLVVPSDSRIFVPQVGEIDVQGLSLSALRKKIADGLSSYVVDPQVMVDIVDQKSATRILDPQVTVELSGLKGQRMFVLGEVREPGAYVVDGTTTLAEVISMAGGLTQDAGLRNILIARLQPGKPRALSVVSLDSYLKTGREEYNPVLHPGDIVYVHTSAIANAGRLFANISKIIAPVYSVESGIWIGQNIIAGPARARNVP